MMKLVWGQVSRRSKYVRERERERFCCTEQICRAKVKVTAGLLPARGRGNLNQQLQHKRAHTISSLGVKWKRKKKKKRLPLCWCEQAIYENICRFYACKRYFAGPQIRLYCRSCDAFLSLDLLSDDSPTGFLLWFFHSDFIISIWSVKS